MNHLKNVKWGDILPRAISDFVIVHCSMLIAFAISLMYQMKAAPDADATQIINDFQSYYFVPFLPLSVLFPIIFLLDGFYTKMRSYPVKAKIRSVALAGTVVLAVFTAANFLVHPIDNPVGRSVAIPFAVIAVLGFVCVRAGKYWLVDTDKSRANEGDDPGVLDGPVLVIGGAGYIGCWLVRRLLEENYRVRVMDSAVYGLEPIQDLLSHPNLEFQEGDCRNIQDVVKAVSGVSAIVHLAAIVGDPACEIDHKATLEINYAATRMLVEVAKGYGVQRVLFASSCSVYGMSDEIMDEKSSVDPISLYGKTKVASERALLEAANESFHPVLMRFATVFGLSNRPRFDLVVNLLSAKARQEGVITVFNGEQWRPFVHVKDLAEAILCLMRAPLSMVSGQIFNVGDNRLNHTLSDVAEVVKGVFPGTRVENIENLDKRNYRVNFDKIEQLVGFQCRYMLEDGVRQIKQAFDQNLIKDYKDTRFSNLVYLRQTGTPGNKSDVDADVMAAFGGEHIRNLKKASTR